MSVSTPAQAPGHGDDQGGDHGARGPARGVRVPCADCRADTAGGLTFVLHEPAHHGLKPGNLLLHRRGTDPADDALLPLAPFGDGRLVAALGRGAELAEGRWDAYLRVADGPPRRLTPGVNDLRALLRQAPDSWDGRIAVRIPYPTKDGFLAVRSWLRVPHAEAGELHVAEAALTVYGRAYGTRLSDRACLELRRRAAPPVVLRVAVTSWGASFSGLITYRALVDAAPPGIWDLWLCPAGEGGARVRMARLFDDIADKKPVVTFPARRLVPGAHGAGWVDVRPYFTLDNDLAVRVGPAEGG